MSNRGDQRGGGGGGGRGRGPGPRGGGSSRGSPAGDRGGSPGGPRGGGSGGPRGGPRGGSPAGRGERGGSPGGGFRGGERGGGPRGGGGYGGGGGGGYGGGGGGFGGRGGGGGGGRGGAAGPVIFRANVSPRIDTQLIEEQNRAVQAFAALPRLAERPLRPGYGTLGVAVALRANFFAVKLPKGPLFDYRVEFKPDETAKGLRKRLFQLIEAHAAVKPHLGYVAHDSASRLVAGRPLPQPLEFSFKFLEDGEKKPGPKAKTYAVSISLLRELKIEDLGPYLKGNPDASTENPLALISALNLVLKQHASRVGVQIGRDATEKFVFAPGRQGEFRLGKGVEAWRGFTTSVRPVFKGLMVNMNACMATVFEPGNMADILAAFSGNSFGATPNLPPSFKREIKITTTYRGYKCKKRLRGIASKTARKATFNCQELGGKVTVEEFFKRKYNVTLKHADTLPLLDLGAKKEELVPAELCTVEAGVPYFAKLSDNETRNMIRFACNPPAVNAEEITERGFQKMGFSPRAGPLDGFGIEISTEMVDVPGRELPAPSLTYKKGVARVKDGSWNITEVQFQRGATVRSWWVLVVLDGQVPFKGPGDPQLRGLVEGFGNKLISSGINAPKQLPDMLVTEPLPPEHADPSRARALGMIKKKITDNLAKKPKPSFILVLLSNRDNYIYPGIKRLGDVELGVHTVHMQTGKALGDPGKQDQYFSNVALKVNAKLGGANHMLHPSAMQWLTKKKTMMVGIDVTHPTGKAKMDGAPSIAAVVANTDDSFVQFPASLRVQKGKEEMLEELSSMIVERLLVYEKHNKRLPERILVFRDGVSEGQFDIVLRDEYPQFLHAFEKFNTKERSTKYRPKLSIIICGKRHHARFYPTSSQHASRNGNTRPGTVVDRGVTSIFDFDFYLQAHAGLQGQVRPTHYTVIYDENQLTPDEIQQGAHTTSYLYARATKAVSLIPPAYYADLACERGRFYINEFLNVGDDKSSTAGTAPKRRQTREEEEAEKAKVFERAKRMWGEGIHVDLRESMFYI